MKSILGVRDEEELKILANERFESPRYHSKSPDGRRSPVAHRSHSPHRSSLKLSDSLKRSQSLHLEDPANLHNSKVKRLSTSTSQLIYNSHYSGLEVKLKDQPFVC